MYLGDELIDESYKIQTSENKLTITVKYTIADQQQFTTDFDILVGVKVLSISVTTEPTTTSYDYGQNFKVAGLVVSVNYSDTTSEVTTSYGLYDDNDQVVDNNYKIYTDNNKMTITVKYNGNTGLSSSFDITVQAIVTAITIDGYDTSLKYGDKLDTSKWTVKSTWSDLRDDTTLARTDYTVSMDNTTINDGYNFNLVGTKDIYVVYNKDTAIKASFVVSVSDFIQSVVISNQPTKKAYLVTGQASDFTASGLVIKAEYASGEFRDYLYDNSMSLFSLDLSSVDFAVAKTYDIGVTYDGVKASNNITITIENVVKEIKIETASSKLLFVVGDGVASQYDNKFDTAGLAIKLYNYDSNGDRILSNNELKFFVGDKSIPIGYALDLADATDGKATIRVEYTDSTSKTFSISYDIEIIKY